MIVPTQTLLEVLSDSSLEVLGIVPVLSKCSIKTNMSVSREEPLFFCLSCLSSQGQFTDMCTQILAPCNLPARNDLWLWGGFLSLEGDEAQRNITLDGDLLKPWCLGAFSG